MLRKGYRLTRRGSGLRQMLVTSRWTAAMEAAVHTKGVDRLVLNYAHGYSAAHLGFLRGLPIRELELLDHWVEDLDPIHDLTQLESLEVTSSPEGRLDLGRFPRLTRLSVGWLQVRNSFHDLPAPARLHELCLAGYTETDLTSLAPCTSLTELVLNDRPRISSLAGLDAFGSLRHLEAGCARRLTDISALASAVGLDELDLAGSTGFDDIAVVSHCSALQSLNLGDCGSIRTLAPLAGCPEIAMLMLWGSTRIEDGDLSVLLSLPNLERLGMMSRRCYTPSVREVMEAHGIEE